MPVNPYSSANTQLTLEQRLMLFSGRETELQDLRQFRLSIGSGSESEQILHIFGAAGCGKSFLIAKLRKDMTPPDVAHLAILDVDSSTFDPNTPAPELLWHLRFALRRAGVHTPLYDLFFVTYFSKYVAPGAALSLAGLLKSVGAGSEPIEKVSSVVSDKGLGKMLTGAFDADFLKDIAEGAEEVAKGMKGVQLVVKLAEAFKKKARLRTLKSQGIDISTATLSEMQAVAPEILSSDLLASVSKASPVLIVIDGFERIQTEPQVLRLPANAERAIETLVRYLMFSTDSVRCDRVKFLIFGRERLRWVELFDRNDNSESWAKHIRQIPLYGFTKPEAEIFLKKADVLFDTAGATVAAQSLRSSAATVLLASREDPSDPPGAVSETRYSPFRLRLCVEEISETKQPFSEGDALDHADDICSSFLRSVPEKLRDVIHVFALAGEVDQTMYDVLVAQHVINGFSTSDFALLVRRDALFAPAPGSDVYRLHFQLEQSSLTLLSKNANSRQIAATVISKIIEQHLRKTTPESYSLLTNENINSYGQGMRLIFRLYEASLLPIDDFAVSFLKLENAIHFEVSVGGRTHQAWLSRLFQLSARWSVEEGQYLVDSKLRTPFGIRARQIIMLMMLHFYDGSVDESARIAAKKMFTRMYAAKVLPPADGQPADEKQLTEFNVRRMSTEAEQLAEAERFEEAASTLFRALKSLPVTLDPMDKAAHEGNLYCELAAIAGRKLDRAQAEAYLNEALSRWSQVKSSPLKAAQNKLRYCYCMLMFVGKEDPAAGMLKEIAPLLESNLPPQHSMRVELNSCMAMLFLHIGCHALAVPYFEKAYDIRVVNYGDKDRQALALRALIEDIKNQAQTADAGGHDPRGTKSAQKDPLQDAGAKEDNSNSGPTE